MFLPEKSVNEKIDRITTKNIATKFGVLVRVVQRSSGRNEERSAVFLALLENTPVNGKVDVSHQKTKNCGRKRVAYMEQFSSVSLSKRTTLRSLSYATKVSKTKLLRRKESWEIRRHSNPIKPDLREDNKKVKLQFCTSMLD